MFDFPDTVRGLDDYDRTWDFFFDSQRGPITFERPTTETTFIMPEKREGLGASQRRKSRHA
jgi:hypothetical protein